MDWNNFYKKRVNSTYQDHFEKKYAPFLEQIIHRSMGDTVIDAGCGIGSVSKALVRHNIPTLGFDICPDMVKLARENVPNRSFGFGDITKGSSELFTVTHGVLEHFEDDVIHGILKRHPNSIHYVPLDGYKTPSFGDERLLPKEFWIETFVPRYFSTFNDGLDLYFVT